MARTAFTKLKAVSISRNIKLRTRIKLIKCYVWTTLLYGCETWTLSKTSIKKIEAFEMWTLRRLLNIPWTDYKTNEEVLPLSWYRKIINKNCKGKKTKVLWACSERTELAEIIHGRENERKRGRGRPRRKRTDDIKEWTEKNYYQCVRKTSDRKNWRSLIFDLLPAEETVDKLMSCRFCTAKGISIS